MEILRIKLHIDRKPMRVLAQYIGFLRQLRIYSHESEDEWFRFITHKGGEKNKDQLKIFGVKNPNFNFRIETIIDLFLGRKYNRKSVFHSKSFLFSIKNLFYIFMICKFEVKLKFQIFFNRLV